MHPGELHVLVIGSGTALPHRNRASPCVVVRFQNETTILDMGPGTLRQLQRVGIPIPAVDHVLLTHFHPDHSADLIAFLFATRHPAILRKRRPFRVIGPMGLMAFMHGLEQAYGRWIRLPDAVMKLEEWPPTRGLVHELGTLRVCAESVRHTDACLAYRFETPYGATLVYSGDTGACESLIALAKGCDLLILECSFPEGAGREGHLTPRQAGELAEAAGAKKLVLVHFYPDVLATDIVTPCRRAYKGELILGRDLLAVRV
jgi:ribonuclease BN (tRNA processing enzyme)